MAEEKEELTEEELVEQFRRMKVSDLVLSTLFTLTQLGYGKLEPSARDLDQARLAIDSLGALLPVAKGALPDEAIRDFEAALANLRLAYAKAAADAVPADTEAEQAPRRDAQRPVRDSGPREGSVEPGGSPEPDAPEG
jgi:hypothetical protein